MGNPWLFIEEGSTITPVNPDLTIDPSTTAPSPDQPGPDRITIWVPSSHTFINLGEAFESLTPSSVRELQRSWSGYSMTTAGAALHESQQNQVMLSSTAEVRVAAERSINIGSPGHVFISSDEHTHATAFAANQSSSTNPTGISNEDAWRSAEKGISIALDSVATLVGSWFMLEEIFLEHYARSPMPAKAGWKDYAAVDVAGSVLKGLAAVGGTIGIALSTADTYSTGGVSLYGTTSVKAHGLVSASVQGGLLASLTSNILTSVSGHVFATVSSGFITNVSGTIAVLSGNLTAKVSSQLGTASVSGKSGVEVTAGNGTVFVTGKKDVQVNSVEEHLYLHGAQGFYLGAGAGPVVPASRYGLQPAGNHEQDFVGFAVRGDATRISVGKVKRAYNFSDPHPDEDKELVLTDTDLKLKHGNNELTMSNSGINLKVGDAGVQILSNGCGIDGQRITLG